MNAGNDPDARFIRMTTEPVSRLVMSLAVPTIASMLIISLYSMVDAFFVGMISTSATGAVGIVFSLMAIIQAVGMTLGIGSGSYVARLLGGKNTARASQAASTAFFLALAWGLILAVMGIVFMDPLMRALGSTETILPYARDYAEVILIGAPFMAAAFVMNANLRSEGSAVLALIGMGAGAVINIALDPIFIFGLGMGIRGAAVATVISQIIGFCILMSHYVNGRSALRIGAREVSREAAMYLELLRSGAPTFFRLFLASFSAIVLNHAAGAYGDAAIAGMSIVTRVIMFMSSLIIGLGQGFQPVAAFNYAAGRRGRVYDAFWFAVKAGTGLLLAYALLAGTFAPLVIRAFRNDPQVIQVGAFALRMQSITLPLSAFIVISNMMFQYIGETGKAALLSLSRQGLILVPTIMILTAAFGLPGLQISQAVADGLTFLMAVPLAAGTLRSLKAGREPADRSAAESKDIPGLPAGGTATVTEIGTDRRALRTLARHNRPL